MSLRYYLECPPTANPFNQVSYLIPKPDNKINCWPDLMGCSHRCAIR